MTAIQTLVLLVKHLPALLKMLEAMQKHAEAKGIERKIADDAKAIEEAFTNKDSDSLRRIFE